MRPVYRLALLFLFVFIGTVQAMEPKKVVFIRYPISPNGFAGVVSSFKATMQARGYVEGKNIVYVDVLTRTADRASVPEVRAAVDTHRASADMFITCGWVSLYVRDLLRSSSVPQLFAPVLRSVALKMLDSLSREPGVNLSGVYLMYPPEKILRLAHLILPGLKRYGYVYDSRIPADMIFKAAYEALPEKDRYGVKLVFVDLARGVPAALHSLKKNRVQAYGGIVGAFQHRQALAASGLPVITSFTMDIERDEIDRYVRQSNVVAGLFNSFAYCGNQVAEMTADIFDSRKTIQETIPRPSRQTAFINLVAAARMGLNISFDALEAVDMVVR
ncbi:ABC transporter substrate-binding protein [Desulfolithobacter sp.]